MVSIVTTGWNDKIVVLKKTILQLYFKSFIEKINSGNLIMLALVLWGVILEMLSTYDQTK